jgi:hypothetical protein
MEEIQVIAREIQSICKKKQPSNQKYVEKNVNQNTRAS